MRTSIELPDALRARLQELAARRGEKGLSSLVADAVTLYLEREATRASQAAAARAVLGSMKDVAADRLEASVRSVRSVRAAWR